MPQRRALAVLAGLAVVLAAVLLLTADSGGRGEERLAVRGRSETALTTIPLAPAPTDPADATTQTTLSLVPVTTGVPVPEATEAPPTTAAPSATPAGPPTTGVASGASAAGSTTVSGAGAVLARTGDATTRPVDKAAGCNSANDPGWKIEQCGALRSGNGVLLWVVETKGKGRRALVLREQSPDKWAVVLAARDDAGTTFSKIGVRGEDVSGDGQPELLFGFHLRDAGRNLAVDVVDASGKVVVHRDLARGAVQASKGRLDTYAAAGDAFDHVVVRFSGGAWRASPPARVARGDVPPSVV